MEVVDGCWHNLEKEVNCPFLQLSHFLMFLTTIYVGENIMHAGEKCMRDALEILLLFV